MGTAPCTGPREQPLTRVPGAGAHRSAARLAAAACLPSQWAGVSSTPLLQLGGCPCVTQELPGGWRWGSAGGRGSFCKLNPDGNCPRRGDGRVTSWSLHTHPVCLSFPWLSILLLYFFSWLLSVLGCPAHPSLFILAHTKLAAHMFVYLFCLYFFKLCKGN